ncbi:SDR family oxidoreductase [uncultured Parolsenella sp.]|uniref:SDR family NAD(P)-dependent oxidoreductase n=1 Tax=uncultured Parolsenella sp. TaxID=2083008 RepID=UPI0027D99357|nr:SDR family oxidoreductase [uncultured Parolsenella sp.]
MNRLAGKVAIVTGANSGVGEAIAKLFCKEGAKVVMAARREAALDAVADQIRAELGECLPVAADISRPGDAERLVAAAIDTYGKLDILVNNAGVLEKGLKPIDRYTDEDLDWVVDINQKGTMRCMRAALQKMEPGASVVNVASVAGAKGYGGVAYVSSKAAIVGVTKNAALRFQATGIRCNAICPGNITTPMTNDIDPAELDPDMIGAMATHSNMASPSCSPEDVANIALFLASDESRSLTGQIIVSDCGSML